MRLTLCANTPTIAKALLTASGGHVRYQLFLINGSRKPTCIQAGDKVTFNIRKGDVRFSRSDVLLINAMPGLLRRSLSIQAKYEFDEVALSEDDLTMVATLVSSLTWFDIKPVPSMSSKERSFEFVPGSTDRIKIDVRDSIEIDVKRGRISLLRGGALYKEGSDCVFGEVLCELGSIDYEEVFGLIQLISLLTDSEFRFAKEECAKIRWDVVDHLRLIEYGEEVYIEQSSRPTSSVKPAGVCSGLIELGARYRKFMQRTKGTGVLSRSSSAAE
jgi:hypothetical protein